MAVDFLPQSSLFIGIIPALALVYLVMRKWTKDFKEKTVFIMFVIGIVSGFITVFLELYVNLVNQVEIILLFRLIQLMIITMVLNLPRLQGKQETVLYGLVLGLGIGSIYPPVSLLLISAETVILTDVISILLGALGLMLLHGATGTLIGYSIFKRKLFQLFVICLILQFIVQYLFFNLALSWMWTLSIVGLIIYLVIQKKILYGIMEQSVGKKRNK